MVFHIDEYKVSEKAQYHNRKHSMTTGESIGLRMGYDFYQIRGRPLTGDDQFQNQIYKREQSRDRN
jgi:hypothetical protein